VLHTSVRAGKATVKETASIDRLEINGPIDPSRFKLTFPPKITVADVPNGVYRETGPDGSLVGDSQPLFPPQSLDTPKGLPTAMQPSWLERSWRWLAVGGLVVAVAVTAAIRARTRRRASEVSG
jgi:hypothetical protein